jgi:ribosomal protein S18 acetylase RimI-like enzyme
MALYQVRALERDDFAALQRLEEVVFGEDGDPLLGPYYLRLCCELFPDSCFLAFADGRPVGYLLAFLRGREVYCTTLGVIAELQATRVVQLLLRRFVLAVLDRVDRCWFTVKLDNQPARALHAVLGARDVGLRHDFYGPGDTRMVCEIDREGFEALRARYQRLGLLSQAAQAELSP